jgi:uncharacterized protein YdeI (YjbR/CyaY-like superfamily)
MRNATDAFTLVRGVSAPGSGLVPVKSPPADIPVKPFGNQQAWEAWLGKNHASSRGLWLKIAKKGSGRDSVSYDEALESALCHGWIDGQKKPFDETWWLQKFTPRGPKSIWSARNRDKAEALVKAGRMAPAGMRAIRAAQEDGRWEAAYHGQRTAEVPPDLQAELDRSPKAGKFFTSLDSANRYAILFRLHNAKGEASRARRLRQFIEMLERGEKLH